MIMWTQIFTFAVRTVSFLAMAVYLQRAFGAGLPAVLMLVILQVIWSVCSWVDWRGSR